MVVDKYACNFSYILSITQSFYVKFYKVQQTKLIFFKKPVKMFIVQIFLIILSNQNSLFGKIILQALKSKAHKAIFFI